MNLRDLKKGLGGFFNIADIHDFGPDGLNVTVVKSGYEVVGQDKDAKEKPVLSFREVPKKLVLSAGRINQLVDLLGSPDADPDGKTINLHIGLDPNSKRPGICIREPQEGGSS
jgi:hypothetical protein